MTPLILTPRPRTNWSRKTEDNPHPDDGMCPEAVMATQGDMNLDGIVDAFDLAELLANWGVVSAAP